MQAYKMASAQTVAAPGGKITRVIRPPNDVDPDSKRSELIENAEDDLEREMDVLKEGTRLRNLEIQTRLNAIKKRGTHWEVKLREETIERDREFEIMQANFIKRFEDAFVQYDRKATAAFDEIEFVRCPPWLQRQEQCDKNFRDFVTIAVPAVIEELQGSVTRRLQKSHETFDIDNTKLLKREKKIKDRIDAHQKNSYQSFVDERQTTHTKLQTFGEELDQTMRTDDREAEKTQCASMQKIAAIRAQIQEIQRVRESEDLEILEKLAQTMARLQQSILTNFGMNKEHDVTKTNNKTTAVANDDGKIK